MASLAIFTQCWHSCFLEGMVKIGSLAAGFLGVVLVLAVMANVITAPTEVSGNAQSLFNLFPVFFYAIAIGLIGATIWGVFHYVTSDH